MIAHVCGEGEIVSEYVIVYVVVVYVMLSWLIIFLLV